MQISRLKSNRNDVRLSAKVCLGSEERSYAKRVQAEKPIGVNSSDAVSKLNRERSRDLGASQIRPTHRVEIEGDIDWRLPGGIPTVQAILTGDAARINDYVDRYGISFKDPKRRSRPQGPGRSYMALLLSDKSISTADKVKFLDGIKNPSAINFTCGGHDDLELWNIAYKIDSALPDVVDNRQVGLALYRLFIQKKALSEVEKKTLALTLDADKSKDQKLLQFTAHLIGHTNNHPPVDADTYYRIITLNSFHLPPLAYRIFIQIPALLGENRIPFLLALMQLANQIDQANSRALPTRELLKIIKQHPEAYEDAVEAVDLAYKLYQGQKYGSITEKNLAKLKEALQKA